MQNGNVGTPVKVFLQLIQSCRLPPRLIRKLGLTFPKTSSSRRYGNVPFHYRDSWTLPATEETVFTAAGHEISGPGTYAAPPLRRRKLVGHAATTEKDEPQKEEEQEEEDAHSNADDVSLNLFIFISRTSNALLIIASIRCYMGLTELSPASRHFGLTIIDFVGCRMMISARSGSAMRLCTRM